MSSTSSNLTGAHSIHTVSVLYEHNVLYNARATAHACAQTRRRCVPVEQQAATKAKPAAALPLVSYNICNVAQKLCANLACGLATRAIMHLQQDCLQCLNKPVVCSQPEDMIQGAQHVTTGTPTPQPSTQCLRYADWVCQQNLLFEKAQRASASSAATHSSRT